MSRLSGAIGASVVVLVGCNALIGITDLPSDESPVFKDGGFPFGSSSSGSSSGSSSSGSSSGAIGSDASVVEDGGLLPGAEGGPPQDKDAQAAPDTGTSCNPETCPTGCCDAAGECLLPSATDCGLHGAACVDCATQSEVCSPAGVCETATTACNSTTCTNGCCSGTTCVVAVTPTTCGPVGVACIDCTKNGEICGSTGVSCVAPSSTDGGTLADGGDVGTCSATCSGCCSGTLCLPGSSNDACGSSGAACQDCTTGGQTCLLSLLCQ